MAWHIASLHSTYMQNCWCWFFQVVPLKPVIHKTWLTIKGAQTHNLRTEKLRHKFSSATLRHLDNRQHNKTHTNKRTSKGSFGVPGCHADLGGTSKWKNLVGKPPLSSRFGVHPRITNRTQHLDVTTRGFLMAELRVETYLTQQETVDSTTRLGS